MKQKPPYIPFFYIIRNTENGMLYAGSRTSKYGNANPDQLLTTYHTSSTTVKHLIESGVKFEIIRTKAFEDAERTLAFEAKFLRLFKCVKNEDWYNRHDGNNLSAFASKKYLDMLQLKYGPGVTCSMHVPGVAQRISDNLKGAINCWDEELKERRRVQIDEYKGNPDRYWHIQSHKYRNKYKSGAKLAKTGSQVYYHVYNEHNQLVYGNLPNFKQFCDNNGMPYHAFHNSAKRGGERMLWLPARYNKADPKFKQYRGWYAVWVSKHETKQDHLPIEPVLGQHIRQQSLKKDYPTVVMFASGTNVVSMYRMSILDTSRMLNIAPATIHDSVNKSTPMFSTGMGVAAAKRKGNQDLIGCVAYQLPFASEFVQANLTKLHE